MSAHDVEWLKPAQVRRSQAQSGERLEFMQWPSDEEIWKALRECVVSQAVCFQAGNGIRYWKCPPRAGFFNLEPMVRWKHSSHLVCDGRASGSELWPLERMIFSQQRTTALQRAMRELDKLFPMPRLAKRSENDTKPFPEDFKWSRRAFLDQEKKQKSEYKKLKDRKKGRAAKRLCGCNKFEESRTFKVSPAAQTAADAGDAHAMPESRPVAQSASPDFYPAERRVRDRQLGDHLQFMEGA